MLGRNREVDDIEDEADDKDEDGRHHGGDEQPLRHFKSNFFFHVIPFPRIQGHKRQTEGGLGPCFAFANKKEGF